MQDWKQESQGQQNNAWMLTFADLLSLILTFFVMLYAMSALIEPKWHNVTSSLTKRLNPDSEKHAIILTAEKTMPKILVKTAIDLHYLCSIVSEKIKVEKALSLIRIGCYEDGLIISLPKDAVFIKDSEKLTSEALEIMTLLEDIFHQIGNRVDVRTYAKIENMGSKDASEWGRGLARAVAVAQELRNFGYNYEIQSVSLPIIQHQKNTHLSLEENKKGLYEISQRVDIVIRSERAAYIK